MSKIKEQIESDKPVKKIIKDSTKKDYKESMGILIKKGDKATFRTTYDQHKTGTVTTTYKGGEYVDIDNRGYVMVRDVKSVNGRPVIFDTDLKGFVYQD